MELCTITWHEFSSTVFKNPTRKEIVEVYDGGETVRLVASEYNIGTADYRWFKFVYTNNENFYIWSAVVIPHSFGTKKIYKDENIRWTVEGAILFGQSISYEEDNRIVRIPNDKNFVDPYRVNLYLADAKEWQVAPKKGKEREEIINRVEPRVIDKVSFLRRNNLSPIKRFRDKGKGG